jgi:hypothetical protein
MPGRDQYFVVLHEDRWKIKHNGTYMGAYETQREAMVEARTLAKKSHDTGRRSQVLVQGIDLQFQTEWSYGEDPRDVAG